VSDDLGNDGGSQQRTTAGNNVGNDVGDVDDRDNGGNASNNAGKGDGGDASGERGGAPGRGHDGGSSDSGGGGCILQGLLLFYCEDIFVWCFYDLWGELLRSHLPSHSRHA
jgi:hypothetical protein